MAVGFGSSSSINSSDEMLGCKSLPLSCVCLIADGALRFFHVVREEESLHNRVCSMGNRRQGYHQASTKVHRAHLISAVITL